MATRTAATIAALTLAAGAQAQSLFFEVESNDTTATAQFITTFTPFGGAVAIDGTKGVGDVDWYQFNFAANSTLLISTIGSSTVPLPDTQLQLVAADGVTIIEFDDDDGPGLLSSLNVTGLAAGTYYIGVSSFADVTSTSGSTTLFDGIDEQTGLATAAVFDYKLSVAVNLVPAPSAMAMLGLGGLVATRRRR